MEPVLVHQVPNARTFRDRSAAFVRTGSVKVLKANTVWILMSARNIIPASTVASTVGVDTTVPVKPDTVSLRMEEVAKVRTSDALFV